MGMKNPHNSCFQHKLALFYNNYKKNHLKDHQKVLSWLVEQSFDFKTVEVTSV